jgi:iron complex transport system substrate-binding protein
MSGRQRTRVPTAASTAAVAVSAGLFALLLAVAAACGGGGGGGGERRATAGDAAGPPAAPRRIVSMSPNVTEILFALGLGERVVGVDDFSQHPPEAAAKPRLGGFVDPDLERIVTLRPDLAVMLESQAELGRELERLGIDVLRVDNQDLEDVAESMVAIGRRAGAGERGAALARDFRAALAPRPVADGERVMIAVGRTPGATGEVMVAGPGSYPYEMVARLGAENVFADLGSRYATVGAEEVVARAPERVLELHWQDLDAAAEAAMAEDWRRLLGPDVEVAVVDGPAVVVPGPRLPTVYDRLEAALR